MKWNRNSDTTMYFLSKHSSFELTRYCDEKCRSLQFKTGGSGEVMWIFLQKISRVETWKLLDLQIFNIVWEFCGAKWETAFKQSKSAHNIITFVDLTFLVKSCNECTLVQNNYERTLVMYLFCFLFFFSAKCICNWVRCSNHTLNHCTISLFLRTDRK